MFEVFQESNPPDIFLPIRIPLAFGHIHEIMQAQNARNHLIWRLFSNNDAELRQTWECSFTGTGHLLDDRAGAYKGWQNKIQLNTKLEPVAESTVGDIRISLRYRSWTNSPLRTATNIDNIIKTTTQVIGESLAQLAAYELFNSARACGESGNHSEAIALLLTAIKFWRDSDFYMLLGLEYMNTNQLSEAERQLRQAIALNANNYAAYLFLSGALEQQYKFLQARDIAESAFLNRNPPFELRAALEEAIRRLNGFLGR